MEDLERSLTEDDLPAAVRRTSPTDERNVSITWDGRRLDSKAKVLAFLAEIDAARASGITLGPPLT